jgi:hypothetical protein
VHGSEGIDKPISAVWFGKGMYVPGSLILKFTLVMSGATVVRPKFIA